MTLHSVHSTNIIPRCNPSHGLPRRSRVGSPASRRSVVLSNHHWRCDVGRPWLETAGDLCARDREITFTQ